jgi:hypothetical protein
MCEVDHMQVDRLSQHGNHDSRDCDSGGNRRDGYRRPPRRKWTKSLNEPFANQYARISHGVSQLFHNPPTGHWPRQSESAPGQNRLLPHCNICGRFSSINRHTIARPSCAGLRAQSFIIDGEALRMRGVRYPSFERLRVRTPRRKRVSKNAFDLVDGLMNFAKSYGLIKNSVPYEDLVATQFSYLWKE